MAAHRRRAIGPAVAVLIAVTAYLNWMTLWTLWTAASEVPWRDQWTYLDDARSILQGHDALNRLWYCFWGHRLVMTRLITALDVRFFSGLNTPIVALSLMLQIGQAAALSWAAWRLFRGISIWVFALTAALIFHLLLSPHQLENLIWGGQIGYMVASAGATAAFFLLALLAGETGLKSRALLAGCVAAGIVSTLGSANGVLVWVVLLLQASILGLPRSVRILLASIACVVSIVYFWGYQAGPPLGMGLKRAVLHPAQSVPLVGMLAAGPISVFSLPLGKFGGCVALAAAAYAGIKSFRARPPAYLTFYGAVAMFAFATIVTMVISRISPEFVASRPRWLLLPSRYFTAPFFLWASLFGISVWLWMKDRRKWPQFVIIGSMVFALTIGTIRWQVYAAHDWRSYYQELDIAATGLILDVHDSAVDRIYPDVPLRSDIRGWLLSNGLSVFHEPRGRLMGTRIQSVDSQCQGAWERTTPVNQSVFRASGWVRDVRDLVFADEAGVVIGLARRGLDSRWQGYFRKPSTGHVAVYGVLANRQYCNVVTQQDLSGAAP
jgi:hypothetical protein